MRISSHRGECSRSRDYPLDNLPPGYRFKPSDHEIFYHLHHKIIHGESLMQNIRDVHLYNFHPQTLTETYPALGDKEWYFFTSRNRKYPKGSKPDRSAENGYWKATTPQKEVMYEGNVMGKKQSLVFVEGDHRNGIQTSWMMHEFTVPKKHRRHTTLLTTTTPTNHNYHNINHDGIVEEWILCRVYENARKAKESPQLDTSEVNTQIHQTLIDTPAAAAGGSGGEQLYINGNDHVSPASMGEDDLIWTLQDCPHPYPYDQTVCNNVNNPPPPAAAAAPEQFYNANGGGYFSSLLMMGEDCYPYLDQTLDYPAPTTDQQFYNGSNQPINPQNLPPYLDQITVDCPAAAAPGAGQFYNGSGSMISGEDLRAVGQECPPPSLDHAHLLHPDSHLNTPHYPDFSVSDCQVDDNLWSHPF